MNSLKMLSCLLGASFFLAACAPGRLRSDAPSNGKDIVAGRFEISEAPVIARHANTVNMLYFNAENNLMLHRTDGVEQLISEPGEKNDRSAHATLHSDGRALYAIWRPKLTKAVEGVGGPGDKLVYLRVSIDGGETFGPVQKLNQGGGAFKPIAASNGKGDVYVAYTDERNSSTAYDIYLNASHDYGASWKKEDVKINGAESKIALNQSLVVDGDRVYVSWMTNADAKQFKIFVRASEDRGETWLTPVEAFTTQAQPNTPTMIKTAKGLMLCWGEYEAVRCTKSSDYGKSWNSSLAIDDSKGAAGLLLEADAQGRPHVLIAQKPADEKARVNLFHAAIQDDGVFSRPQRVNSGEAFKSSAILPVMSFGEDGSALVAWVDMRYLRAVIAANYSPDNGNTWLNKDIVLAAVKGEFSFFPTVAYAGGGNYSIAWQSALNRSDAFTKIGLRNFRPNDGGIAMLPPDPARLKVRVDAFWKLREEGNWDDVYKYLDPFFREAIDVKHYVKTQGNVKYYEHRLVGEPEIVNVRGSIKVAYVSEVPELMLQGKKISVPKQEVEIDHEWIWVDGDWYNVFRDIMGGSFQPELGR